MISVATAADKRALNELVTKPGAGAATTLASALAEPPTDPKQLAWMLVWAGKVALGPRPTDVSTRTELCAAIDPHRAERLAVTATGTDSRSRG